MTREHHDWDAIIAAAARRPGQWMLMFPNRNVRLAKRIRLRQHPKLRRPDGALEATVKHEYQLGGEAPKGDVWVRWVPTPATEEKP